MGYEVAINKAWDELAKLNPGMNLTVRFLGDEYSVDLTSRKLLSLSCNVGAKDFTAILILHYLEKKLKGLADLGGDWLTFREFSGIEGYYPAFRKRAIEPVIRKYGRNPKGVLDNPNKLPLKKYHGADASVIVEAFEGVPVLVKIWQADSEFGPDANMYFDANITRIFCVEDIIVLASLVAGAL
ncbi:MAG: DUF3786 domain-containing protein [Candidatus Omnitrophica bacterium]|nr:DUF3786 domain-containing protein [Candidatus Omnitrophota bacterium]